MKRLALSISIAAAALGLGACEPRSSADLPDHYLHKGTHHDKAAPAPSGEKHAPAGKPKS